MKPGVALLLLGALLAAAPSAAEDDARIDALERRIEQLEGRAVEAEERARVAEQRAGIRSEDTPRVTLSGSADFGWFDGERNATTDGLGARVWDARLFVDAELAEDVRVGTAELVRNIGFSFEWNLLRRGELANDVGELYVDFQGVGGSSWLNVRPGRFQIPVGESYKRYSRGAGSNPFISNPVGGPWWWDEGVMLYGQSGDASLGYVASLTNGETPLDFDAGDGEQTTLKLWSQPTPWLYVSLSGLHSGEVGSGGGALWLGETWATPVGAMTGVPTYYDGSVVPPTYAPFDSAWLLGGDLVLTPHEGVRLWLAAGRYALDSRAGEDYDRALLYWIGELVLRGSLLRPALAPGYLGLRVDGVATNEADAGYLLDIHYAGSLGYNMRALKAYTLVLGWRLGRETTLRAEYSLRDIDLVPGVSPVLRDAASAADNFAIEVGVAF